MPAVGDDLELVAVDADRAPQRVTLTVVDMDGLRVDHVRLRHAPIERPGEDGDA
jgi:hypothetical protein